MEVRSARPNLQPLVLALRTRLLILVAHACWLLGVSLSRAADANAALQYWLAFALCPEQTKVIADATSDDEKVGYGIPVSQSLSQNLQGDTAEALIYLHRGAQLDACEWGVDVRKDGPNVPHPYCEKAHALARVSLLRARWRFEHGDWDGGIEDVVDTMKLARHLSRDRISRTVHYACMLEAMATKTADVHLPGMPEHHRVGLAARLDKLPPLTSMRDAVLYQTNAIDWAIDRFKQAGTESQLLEVLIAISDRREAKRALEI